MQTEDEALVAEFLGGVAWRSVLDTVIAPRIEEVRRKLLFDSAITELDRVKCQAVIAEYKTLLERLYAVTEAHELPEALRKKYFS